MADNGPQKIDSDQVRSRFREPERNTKADYDYRANLNQYFAAEIGSTVEKLENFAKYVPRQMLTRFLARYEIFKKSLTVQGSVVECGVLFGGGLMTFAQISSILEPLNYQRLIIGFDTFSGFSEPTEADKTSSSELMHKGGLRVDCYEDLQRCINIYDSNRSISHISKVILVKGDAKQTIPNYLEAHPYTVVSLLYLDFDLFEPTKVAIEQFVPRMPKGAIIVFDELNHPTWPGETLAVLKTLGIRNLRIKRLQFEPLISYVELE